MRSGKLRHFITIQRAVEAANEYGEPIQTWGTFADVHAAVEPLRGQELMAAQALQARVTTRIRIRFLSGITPKMRIQFGEKTYLIVSIIDEEERHINMQIMAEEWVVT